jgi:hypothetical protein
MQNLSNATTEIQLNSIPEKKTSKRETFFSYLENAPRSDTEKKDMKISFSTSSPAPSRDLVFLFLHASFPPLAASEFSTFFLSLLCEEFLFCYCFSFEGWYEANIEISTFNTMPCARKARWKDG